MTGPKLNEYSFVAGERAGTKASAKYMRFSASKARAVLDIIRGLPVRSADEVLQFTDRDAATVIRKVLASAVANAQHNDEQDPEELFVIACYADEGPTLKRFKPRAKGRASRINKRTCHITVVVARLDDDRLEIVQAREARRTTAGRRRNTGGTTASRKARVERSRQRATALKTGDDAELMDEVEASDEIDEVADEEASKPTKAVAKKAVAKKAATLKAAKESADVSQGDEGSASDEAQAARGESAADAEPASNGEDN